MIVVWGTGKASVGQSPGISERSIERLVEIRTVWGTTTAFFVRANEIEGDRVRVIAERSPLSGNWQVILPTDHPYLAVSVPEEDLRFC